MTKFFETNGEDNDGIKGYCKGPKVNLYPF